MRIRQISVTNLFGVFNHVVNLNTEESITIIHGPNGFGKTVLLNMVDGLFSRKFGIFRDIPFDVFRVDLENETTIMVERIQAARSKKTKELKITLKDKKSEVAFVSGLNKKTDFPLGVIEDIIPELTRVGPREWRDLKTGRVLSYDDVIDEYGIFLPMSDKKFQELSKKISALATTHFIKTNRLQTRPNMYEMDSRYVSRRVRQESEISAVLEHSKELSRRIQTTLAKSVELSSSLDRSFPNRLVERIGKSSKKKLTEQSIHEELAQLEEKRARLTEAGLLDKEEESFQLPEQEVTELTRVVLSIYVQDVKEKLAVFDHDLQKIELFRDILNRRFGYKKLSVSKDKGFAFTLLDGSELSPDALSSGEQHEIVLLYELLFKVNKDSLILLDEPEISLHIGWQQKFLEDIKAITKLTGFDVLIATHSPDIIYDRWDLTVELKGPNIQKS